MSRTPTPGSAAAKSSGRWLTTAATSSPPLDSPWIARPSAAAMPSLFRCSAAAMKSSKTFYRNARAVLRMVEALLDHDALEIDRNLGPGPGCEDTASDIIAVDRCRRVVTGE